MDHILLSNRYFTKRYVWKRGHHVVRDLNPAAKLKPSMALSRYCLLIGARLSIPWDGSGDILHIVLRIFVLVVQPVPGISSAIWGYTRGGRNAELHEGNN